MNSRVSQSTPTAQPLLRLQPRRTSEIRVLIVDDEESVRLFVDRVLRSAGYQTALAPDGPSALQIASTPDRVDLLLTDLMMPGMKGDELARQLRVTTPSLKVLYFTGFSELLFAERSTLWEDEVFLDKPATASGLLQAVLQLLNSGQTST